MLILWAMVNWLTSPDSGTAIYGRIYPIYMKYCTIMLAASLLGLTAITNATTNQAFACGLDNIADCFSAGASSGNGYYAGQQDAIYDHDHNLVYNPQPQVNVYHPVGYADQFRQGYDNQWNLTKVKHLAFI